MVKFYIKKVRRLLAVMAVCLVAANASATPYKNIHILLQSNAEGRGKVYVKSEVPSGDPTQTRKAESSDAKVTIGENGNDLSRPEGTPLRGFYMAGLFGEPEDGFKLAGFSLELKEDAAYTKADLLVPAASDSNGFTDVFGAEGGLCFNANCDRPEDANSSNDAFQGDDQDDNVQAYNAARALNNWSEEPDHVIYAVFVPESYEIPEGDGTEGIKDVQTSVMATQTYTLTGQKASAAHRGIVILNGKKVVRK